MRNTSIHCQIYSVNKDRENKLCLNNNAKNNLEINVCIERFQQQQQRQQFFLDKTANGDYNAETRAYFSWQVIYVADEYVMLVKGAETAVLDQLASGPRDVTLDHVNEYAEVCILVWPY